MKKYKDDHAQAISFPLSGIGTGGVSISGTGQLIDWELDGRANKGAVNEYTHFAIKAERGGKTVDARVLHGDVLEGLNGSALACHHHSWGYGQGPNRTTLAGLAHFDDVSFSAEFPFAELSYKTGKMPADISLSCFNPFIPGDEDNSSLPAAFFDWEIINSSNEKTDYTLAFSSGNPFRISDGGYSEYAEIDGISSITLRSRLSPADENYGELVIATDCKDISYQEYWYRSGWFDDVTTFWREFTAPGKLKNRHYDDDDRRGQLDIGDMCTLAAHFTLEPGEAKKISFVMAWYYPNFVKYWDEERPSWKHEYAGRFGCSADVLDYCFKKKEYLYRYSSLFAKAVSSLTIPAPAKEAAANTLCVLKSATCLRLENGEFWAFEGTNADSGSCEGTCDHVWGYQYSVPFLFPRFARQMLETDYTYNMKPSGEMMFRTMLPLGSGRSDFRACVDGQMGCIIRFYREWKLSGDDEWLKKWWDKVKYSLEYAWSPENRDRWNPGKTGIITGRQHHTLDMELFGANAWLNGFYLAALKACSEIAAYLGENEKAEEYLSIFRKGQEYTERELFNGRHYIQKIDLNDRSVLDVFAEKDPGVYGYWNDEKNELKYQTASGCIIDQLLAQWHASISGLGDIFDPGHRKTAAASLYALNFKLMRDFSNPCRIFAANDEKGLVICEWADDEYRPAIPVPYSQECMSGFEYAAAGIMLLEGLYDEGCSVISSVRERYDGKKRNPFSEIECGAFYARAMSAFSFPAIFEGYSFDMPAKKLGFAPIVKERPFSGFWSVDGAWGTVEITETSLTLSVLYGAVRLKTVSLPSPCFAAGIREVLADGKNAAFRINGAEICLDGETEITASFTVR